MEAMGIPAHIFPAVVPPGAWLGSYAGIPVIAPACHDTGSAVAAVPAAVSDYAYVSSGTWSLVGLETDRPILTAAALAANVTNEGGVYGTIRLLKNLMGLWILQQCRATWSAAGQPLSYGELVALAREADPLVSIFNPNDPAFLPPGDHPQRIADLCVRLDQPIPATVGAITRSVLESLALAYRSTLEQLMVVSGRSVAVLHIVGGGGQNELLNQMTADATGLPVVAGPTEATVIGNALVQLISLGEIADLRQGRAIIAKMNELRRYEPRDTSIWDEAYGRYRAMCRLTDSELNDPAG
jgi:rhamnulokinase